MKNWATITCALLSSLSQIDTFLCIHSTMAVSMGLQVTAASSIVSGAVAMYLSVGGILLYPTHQANSWPTCLRRMVLPFCVVHSTHLHFVISLCRYCCCCSFIWEPEFRGSCHPLTRANYLVSPPLVVAYTLAGSMILYDTPGVIEKQMHKLDSMMMKNVRNAAIDADCVLVVDASKAY
ncbi:hypothetical protein Vadar_021081 [Vaccinium darrowii]|uniref:Uncharacterized protein n=1 Tax=Vaccinium darrowii TaxID=229202 RepID=A0ACB7XIW3_9ERIC|nr:hypothetical protein Vadar_021081 [Vaccinium darrowii]